MERQLFLTTFIVSFGLVSVQLNNQMSIKADPKSKTQVNLRNLFDSLTKNNMKNAEDYRTILKREAEKEQHAFDAFKSEFRLMRQRDAQNKTNQPDKYGNGNEEAPAIKRKTRDIDKKQGIDDECTYEDWETMNSTGPLKKTRKELMEDLEIKMGFLLSRGLKVANETLKECYEILNVRRPEDGSVVGQEMARIPIGNRPNEDENLYEWCSDWLNDGGEVDQPEFAHLKGFCLRILDSDNDADRFQAQQYMGAIYREMKKLDTVMANIVMRLSEYNDTKEAYLTNPEYRIPFKLGVCYWSLHEIFKKFCMDPELNDYSRSKRNIFVHACEAEWLTVVKCWEIFEDVCRDVRLFENLPTPPDFLFRYEQ